MKRKSIKLKDIQVEEAATNRQEDITKLASSIHNLGLQTPILVNPASLSLVSGRRRYNACKKLGLLTVRVAFPDNTLEACEELGDHVTDPDPMYAISMNSREKLGLALRLNELPKPSGHTRFDYDSHSGPAVDLSARIMRRLRPALQKAREGDPKPDEEALAARKILSLMLEAIDQPLDGYSSSQIVCHLSCMLREGVTAETLGSISMPDTSRKNAGKLPQVPTQADPAYSPRSGSRLRTQGEYRRGVDNISGALAGLEVLLHMNPPTGEYADHVNNVLRQSQKSIRQMLKNLQEAK